jgi:ABC-type Fe3+ transport system substrate-binding protein
MRRMLWATILLIAMLSAPNSGAQAQPEAPNVQTLIDGARAEGQLVIWITTPAIPRTHVALLQAFNKRFGLSVKYEWLPMHPTRSLPRLVTEAKGGRVPADVLGSFSYDDMLVLRDSNLLRPYPWSQAVGKALPTISEPAERLIPEVQGLGLAYIDQVFLLAWNKDQIKEPDLPHKLTDLTDPKWKRRFVTNAVFGLPIDTLSLALGRESALALARKLIDNAPLLKNGSPAVTQAIVAGEAPIGIGTFLEANKAAKLGRPLGYRLLEDYVPLMPLHVIVPERAPHPNAARLFAAWFVTEGVSIVNDMEAAGRVTETGSELAQLVSRRDPEAQLVMPKNAAQVQDILKIRRELNLMFTGR